MNKCALCLGHPVRSTSNVLKLWSCRSILISCHIPDSSDWKIARRSALLYLLTRRVDYTQIRSTRIHVYLALRDISKSKSTYI